MNNSNYVYESVARQAQDQADRTGYDVGIEDLGGQYRYFLLPAKKYRSGYELRCEVRSCSNIDHTKPGHGHR